MGEVQAPCQHVPGSWVLQMPPMRSSREGPHRPDISLGEQRIRDASALTVESLQGLMARMLGVDDGGLWQSSVVPRRVSSTGTASVPPSRWGAGQERTP